MARKPATKTPRTTANAKTATRVATPVATQEQKMSLIDRDHLCRHISNMAEASFAMHRDAIKKTTETKADVDRLSDWCKGTLARYLDSVASTLKGVSPDVITAMNRQLACVRSDTVALVRMRDHDMLMREADTARLVRIEKLLNELVGQKRNGRIQSEDSTIPPFHLAFGGG